jgi:hypothetical protein
VKDFDPKLIECLLTLPPEIFSAEENTKIQNITYPGVLFPAQPNNKPAEAVDLSLSLRAIQV